MYIDEMKDEILRLDLINRAKKSAKEYFFQWRSESENEQTKYPGQDINAAKWFVLPAEGENYCGFSTPNCSLTR